MARIDWVRRRLENWARWCAQRDIGGGGYPSMSAFARMAPSGGSRDAAIPIMDLDASEINDIVESFRLTQSHLHLVLTLTYAKGMPRHKVAKTMGRAESTVKANLEQADHAIARVLEERQERKRSLST
jgi:DNA-directed RNA polymerase specialized sigma24 family protein